MTKNQLNTFKENGKNVFWWLNYLLPRANAQKRKMSAPKKCHHFNISGLLTFLHSCMRDSHFKCQQAHSSQRGEAMEGGYCRRADLIKRQAAIVAPPHSSPPHLSSTERGNKSDRVQSLSLICQWGEWGGMRLSDQPAVVCLPCQPYWIMTAGSGMLWAMRGHGEISQAWIQCEPTGWKSNWNETCLYVKFMMSFMG